MGLHALDLRFFQTSIQQFARVTSIGSLPPKTSENPADPRKAPQRPRRALGETPQSPPRDPRRALSEANFLGEPRGGCAPRMVTLRNFSGARVGGSSSYDLQGGEDSGGLPTSRARREALCADPGNSASRRCSRCQRAPHGALALALIPPPCPTYQLWPFSSAKENHSDSVKRHLSRRHLSVLNFKFNFIFNGGRARKEQIALSLKRHLFPHGSRKPEACWICFSTLPPISNIFSNF